MKVDNELENTEVTKEDIAPNEKAQVNIISPTKKLNYGGGHETTGGSGSSGCSLSTMVSVKRSPTVGFFHSQWGKIIYKRNWYFVTKIVLTYCEKKNVLVIEKNF